MGDFVQSNNVKSAVRKLANPIADVTAFNTIVQSVITSNPFACVAYTAGSGNYLKSGAAPKTKNPAAVGRGVATISYIYTF